jgi:hypothetical protein
MKTIALVCAAVMLLAATASAGDLAVSKSTLTSMGLGSMRPMSDTEGAAVRGKLVSAAVWGGSQVIWLGPANFGSANNNYAASASWLGPVGANAAGGSLSFAGQADVLFQADPTGFFLQVQVGAGFAGGGAFATAN